MKEPSARVPEQTPSRVVVHVSIVHRASDIRIFHKQCRSLADAGHTVTLYARAPVQDLPEGTGVRVVHVPEYRSRLTRMTVGVARLLRPLWRERADVYHLHDPELIPLGLALRARGRTVVFDAHEPLPDQIFAKSWIPGPLRRPVAWLTRLLVRIAGRGLSAVVAASPLVAETYAGAKRLVTVANFPILHPHSSPIPYDERSRGVVYVGGISELRGLASMLDVARFACRPHGEKLTLIGPFSPPELEARLDEHGLRDVVDYLGVQPPDRARQLVAEAKVGLILQIGPPAYRKNLPTKMFEYMAEGLPVVASDFPLWREILDEAGAGVVVAPEDGQAAAEAVSKLLADPAEAAAMGERGRKAVHDRYHWEPEARKLLSLYAELA
ncbi:MAG TPA: glycosyltransferase family 4 protein [Actinopolymorphaceae bacterium]